MRSFYGKFDVKLNNIRVWKRVLDVYNVVKFVLDKIWVYVFYFYIIFIYRLFYSFGF